MKLVFLKLYCFLLAIFSRLVKFDFLKNHSSNVNYKYQRYKLSKKGVTLGYNSVVYNTVFSSSAKGDKFFIGKNCTITGSTLLGHDASPTVFISELINKPQPWMPGARSSYRKPIYIGDNVFIGYGSIILPGVIIGNNVIVAAGSVVISNIPDNSVYGGNPAKFIKNIDEFIGKYKKLLAVEPEAF
ncbi:acyltransferase [Shewanella sp. S-1]|uniref:Acyltransferase n=1 Tax=Shewanella oncorhynchi TaxID=2726434 RepID=A0ABX1KNB7_9GAMM|nr:acyltransferase [Shewanella oncorhynchi]NLQ22803.1 acyltransferase [Shewanella oncorhynchi]